MPRRWSPQQVAQSCRQLCAQGSHPEKRAPLIRPLPDTIRQVLGDEAAIELEEWWEQAMGETAVAQGEFDKLENRMASVEDRLRVLDRDVTEVKTELRILRSDLNQRFDALRDGIDARLDRQTAETNARFDAVNERLASQTRWSVAALGAFGTAATLLLVLAQYGP